MTDPARSSAWWRRTAVARVAWLVGAAGVVALSIAVRLPYLTVPLTADEGGYGYIARFWSRGDTLYSQLWIDRPQLLVLAYQAAHRVFGEGGEQLRLAGAVYNALSAIAVMLVAARVLGWRIALACGAAFAWFSAAPRIEGFTTNGELLTTLPSTLAVLAIVVWVERACAPAASRRALALPVFAAGLLAGTSFLFKQSGVDAAATLVFAATVLVATRRLPRRRAAAGIALFVAAMALPVGASVAHGLATAGHDYTYEVFTYRMRADSFFAEPLSVRYASFRHSLPAMVLELGPLLALAPFGCLAAWRGGVRGVVLVAWLAAALLAVVAGGQFHPHYYVAAVPALVLVAGAALRWAIDTRALPAMRRSRWRSEPVLAAVALAALVWTIGVVALDSRLMRDHDKAAVSWKVFHEPRYLVDASVGRYLRSNSDRNATVYAMYAGSDLYYYAHRRSPYPYLWFRGVARIPGAVDHLRALLQDRKDHPDYVALVQQPSEIDPAGDIERLLRAHYQLAATVNGVRVLRANAASYRA